MTDTEHRIQVVLSEVFDILVEDVSSDTSPDTIEAWDSLQHLSLVLALEEEFTIRFDEEELPLLVSYPLIVNIVSDHLNGHGEPSMQLKP